MHPSRIRQQGLVFFRIGGSDSAAGLPFRLRCRQGQVGKFAVLAQVVLDDFVFGQHVQLVPQELPGFHGGFSLPGQKVDVILEQVFKRGEAGVRPGLGIQVQVGGDGILFGSVVAAHQPLRLFLEFPDNLRGHHVSLDLRVRNAAFIYVGERTGLDFQQFVPEFGCEDNALVSGVSPELAVHHPVYLGRGIDFEVLACLALVRKVGQVRGLGQFQLPGTFLFGIEGIPDGRLPLCFQFGGFLCRQPADLVRRQAHQLLQSFGDFQKYLPGFRFGIDIDILPGGSLVHDIGKVPVGGEFHFQSRRDGSRCDITFAALRQFSGSDSRQFLPVFGREVFGRELFAFYHIHFLSHRLRKGPDGHIGVGHGFSVDFKRTEHIHRSQRGKHDFAQSVPQRKTETVSGVEADGGEQRGGTVAPGNQVCQPGIVFRIGGILNIDTPSGALQGEQSADLQGGGTPDDFQNRCGAGFSVMHGKVTVFCSAALRAVVIDTDTTLIRHIRGVIDVVSLDADSPDPGVFIQRSTAGYAVFRNPGQFLALFHETERAVRPDDNLVDKQTVQVGTDGGMAVRLDDAFEHVAVPAADGDGGLGADFFLPGERSGQHQILLDGLPGKRCIEQDSIAAEELVDEPGCIALRHLDGRRQFVSNRIDRIRDSLGSGTEITGTPALVDLIGVDHRFMPVDFVYIIGIDSIGAAVETAYLSAEPDITRGDAGTLDLASGDDEVRAAVKNGTHAESQFLQVQDIVRVGIPSAGFRNIFFHCPVFLLGVYSSSSILIR